MKSAQKLIGTALFAALLASPVLAQSNVVVSGAGSAGSNVDMDLNTRSGTLNPAIGNPPINDSSRIQADVEAEKPANPTQKRIDANRAKIKARQETLINKQAPAENTGAPTAN
ncbi:hypothetical protein GC177_03875 [bacterium]|nr:hypothetical protein [bacterium]